MESAKKGAIQVSPRAQGEFGSLAAVFHGLVLVNG